MNTVSVQLGQRSYEILLQGGLLDQCGSLIQNAKLTGKAAIISDDNVAPHYLERVTQSLIDAGYTASSHLIPAGEASKSMTQADQLCQSLIAEGHDRSSFVIA